MSYLVSATGYARRQIDTAGRWWVANRPKPPDLFAAELEATQDQLAAAPLTSTAFPTPRCPGARRLMLPKTRYHLYYAVEEEAGIVLIRAVWHASRGRVPAIRWGASTILGFGAILCVSPSPHRDPWAST